MEKGEHIIWKFQEICPEKARPLFHCFLYLMHFSISEAKHQLIWWAQSYPSQDSSCCKPPKHLPKPKQTLLCFFFFFFKIPANKSLLFLGKLANSGPTASALSKSLLCSIVLKHTDFFSYYLSQQPCCADCMKITSQIQTGTSFFQLQHCPPQHRTLFPPQDREALCPLFTSTCLIMASLGNTPAVALLAPASL